jgi:hypothetical protein
MKAIFKHRLKWRFGLVISNCGHKGRITGNSNQRFLKNLEHNYFQKWDF